MVPKSNFFSSGYLFVCLFMRLFICIFSSYRFILLVVFVTNFQLGSQIRVFFGLILFHFFFPTC
jgi:hypothetical protein